MSVSDDFNRADAATLGANWTDLAGGMRIVSNAARGENASSYDVAIWSANTFNAAHSSQAVIVSGFADIALYVRASGSGASCVGYHAMVHGSVGMRIYRRDSGPSFTLLADLGGAVTAADIIKLDVNSTTTLEYYKNGASQGNTTDGTYSSGSAGICSAGATGDPAWDDWVGTGEVGGGGGLSIPIAAYHYQHHLTA